MRPSTTRRNREALLLGGAGLAAAPGRVVQLGHLGAGLLRAAVAPLGDLLPALLARLGGLLLERLAGLLATLRRGQPADQHAEAGDAGAAVDQAAAPLAPLLAALLGALAEQLVGRLLRQLAEVGLAQPLRGGTGRPGLAPARLPGGLGRLAGAGAGRLGGRAGRPPARLRRLPGGLGGHAGPLPAGRGRRPGDRVAGVLERIAELVELLAHAPLRGLAGERLRAPLQLALPGEHEAPPARVPIATTLSPYPHQRPQNDRSGLYRDPRRGQLDQGALLAPALGRLLAVAQVQAPRQQHRRDAGEQRVRARYHPRVGRHPGDQRLLLLGAGHQLHPLGLAEAGDALLRPAGEDVDVAVQGAVPGRHRPALGAARAGHVDPDDRA